MTKPGTTYQQQFMTRTATIFRHMRERFAEKADKRGHVIRIGRVIPFTLAEFREKVLDFLGGEYAGSVPCIYCDEWVTLASLASDHADPVSRGGSLSLDNIEFPCHRCNQRKGSLTRAEYSALYKALQSWPEAARRDVLHRLEIAVQLAAKDRSNRARKIKQQKPTQETEPDGGF